MGQRRTRLNVWWVAVVSALLGIGAGSLPGWAAEESTGGGTGEIRQDRQEIREDRQEIRGDRKELRQDRKEIRGDRKERRQDRRELRKDVRQNRGGRRP